jgi:predicted transcriptional regulator
MQTAINEYLDREERRETFKQEAIASYKRYQQTGLHVTGDEVTKWASSWGSDNVLPAPICHR